MIFSNLKLNSNEPIYYQIEKHIKKTIENGILSSNSKLPATRELSKIIGVSRNSVITAYENLELEGVVYTIKGKGTFVTDKNIALKGEWNIEWEKKSNEYADLSCYLDTVKSEIPWERGMISFKSISPDGELFDVEEFKKAFLNRIALEGHKILNYGYAQGYKPLIDYLHVYMNKKGVNTDNKDFIITNGFTEGLQLILSSYTNAGDNILCENPTHNTSIKLMKLHKLNLIGVDIAEDGIDLMELEYKLKNNQIKIGYLTPSYNNPTGIVINGEKRFKIYNLFKQYNVPIIEDGFNEELHYNNSHIAPLAAFDGKNNGVIYIGSFSKILFPGIRVGWVLADKKIVDTLESVKRCYNIHTSFLDQAILYEYLRSGAFEKQIKRTRKYYKEKHDFVIKCLDKYLKPKYIWGEYGMHVYIAIEGIDSRKLLQKCYERKVIFAPGDIFDVNNEKTDTLRLGLSRITMEEIEEGIRIISECVDKLKIQ